MSALEERKRKAQIEEDARTFCYRSFPVGEMELRTEADGTIHVSGYASITGRYYPVGWYEEKIDRGAFKRTLAEGPDVQLLVNHEGLALARTKSGTLTLVEDTQGLKIEADLDPERQAAKEVASAIRRGDVDQMSFAFLPREQTWSEDRSKRSITDAGLHRGDVSVVNQGANPSTTIATRSREDLHGRGTRALIPSYSAIARAKHARLMSDTTRRGSR